MGGHRSYFGSLTRHETLWPRRRPRTSQWGLCAVLLAWAAMLLLPALAFGFSPNIIGGGPAPAGSLPWLAYITFVSASGEPEACTGTIVSSNVILTAGHCAIDVDSLLTNPASSYTVYTGSLDWTDGAQVSGVSDVIPNPEWNVHWYDGGLPVLDDDVALLELESPTTAPAITLASDATDSALYTAGTDTEIAGWGDTTGFGTLPTAAQVASTVVQSASYCAQQAELEWDAPFDAGDQMCIVDPPSFSTGQCHGDSGGPVLSDDASDMPVEIGVISWGDPSCSTSDPGYDTRVDVFSGWIADWIATMRPPSPTTGLPSGVSTTSAVLNGTVDPHGNDTSYWFQWGSTSAYGFTAGTGLTNNGTTPLGVQAQLGALSPGTTYHYRLVASNGNGTVDGADETFATASPPASSTTTATTTTTTTTASTPTTSTTPTTAASPTTTPDLPEYGTYNGRTSQRWPITIRLNGSLRLTHLKFSYSLRCTHGRVSYSMSPLGDGVTWKLNADDGMGFRDLFRDTSGTRYTIAGLFTTTGAASGTLNASWSTRKLGSCSTGKVRWSAH